MSQAQELSRNEERLSWIMGSSRSGSTWLMRMLGNAARAVTIDDPHIGHHLGVWRPVPLAWATFDGPEPPELQTLDEVKRERRGYFFNDRYRDAWEPALRELILARFGAEVDEVVASRHGSVEADCRVIVKEPGSHAADILLPLFPRSGLIFLLRDGRDVVDSWLAAYRDGSWAQEEGAYPLADHGRLAMIGWQAAVWAYRTNAVAEAFERHRGPKVLVRYTDLLDDTAGELTRIAGALGFAMRPGVARETAERFAFESVPRCDRGPLQEVRAADPGSWREHMTAEEVRVLNEALGPTLARFGFEGAKPSARILAANR